MANIKWSIAFAIVLLLPSACTLNSPAGTTKPPPGQSDSKDAKEKTSPAPQTPKQDPNSSEAVNPPAQVSGAFLYCVLIPDPNQDPLEAKVGCSLRSGSEFATVEISSASISNAWSFGGNTAGLMIEVSAGSASEEFQQVYVVRSSDGHPVHERTKALAWKVSIKDGQNAAVEKSATVETGLVSWFRLDGKPIPANAIIAGSEGKGSTLHFICRVHFGEEVVLGKMVANFNGGGVCYVNSKGRYIESNRPADGQTNYPSEVMILDYGRFKDILDWVPASGSQAPLLAVTGGTDPEDSPLNICRALNNGENIIYPDWYTNRNDPAGEFNPGELSKNRGCTYNYLMQFEAQEYQVLTWKSQKLKEIMDARISVK